MKKILSLVLALFLILPLALSVFATQEVATETITQEETQTKEDETQTKEDETQTEEENTPTGSVDQSTAYSVELTGITLPLGGDSISSNPVKNANIKLLVKNADTLSELRGISTTGYWTEKDKADVPLTSGTFVSGRTYRLWVTLEFQENAPEVKDNQTQFSVNRQEASFSQRTKETIVFYCDFIATPKDFTPEVTLTTEGNKTKEYDGKEIILSAKVEKMEGIEYTYTWYKNNTEVKGQNADSIKLKNVSQSGEYSCKVTATLGSSGSGSFKTTTSESVKIQITRHVIMIKLNDVKKNLFSPDPELTYTLKGDIYDELTGALTREEGEDEGEYEIKIGTLSFDPSVSENYDVQVEGGKLLIENNEELPIIRLENITDKSLITGKNDSKIKVFITKGSIPEGAVLTLNLPESEAKEKAENKGESVLKGFSISLVKKDQSTAELSQHAKVKIQIPLTKEEETTFDPATITAALYDGSLTSLPASLIRDGEVNYILIETEGLGTILLYQGEKLVKNEAPATVKKEEKGGNTFLWIVIVAAILLSAGAIAFTIWQIRQTDRKPAPKKATPAPSPEKAAEKERMRKIAEELNALSPIPEEAVKESAVKKEEKAAATRPVFVAEEPAKPFSDSRPILNDPSLEKESTRSFAFTPETKEDSAMKTKEVPVFLSSDEKSDTKPVPKQISFEDLED